MTVDYDTVKDFADRADGITTHNEWEKLMAEVEDIEDEGTRMLAAEHLAIMEPE